MEALASDDAKKRKILFTPLESKEDLHAWISLFLDLEMPDCVVDEREGSSSPMDMIWSIYERGLKNDDPSFSRALAYASRDSFKTLGAAILEVLMMVHLKRSIVHLAAIEQQSLKSQEYVKDFLSRPYLRDFLVGDAKRKTRMLRYTSRATGDTITLSQWEQLPSDLERQQYEKIDCYIKILVMTPQSTNSDHVPFMVCDEVDVVTKSGRRAYEEAKMIPSARKTKLKGGKIEKMWPITLLISTRKTSTGLVQDEIDKAGQTGLQIKHWNLIDVTEACPTTRHQPEKGKLPIYRSDDLLRFCSPEDYEKLTPDKKLKYVKDEGYYGCLNNCRLFPMCKGNLATKQKSKSPLLKEIPIVENVFRTVSVETAQAQLLCWKPSAFGLIYSRLERGTHLKSAADMAHMITGDDYPPFFGKDNLIELMKQRGLTFYAGMDFGFTKNYAGVVGARDGHRMFIFDCFGVPGLELGQKLDLVNRRWASWDPIIFGDVAEPSTIKSYKKAGFKMRAWKKEKDSIKSGIEIVRAKLMPAIGDSELFFLADDEGIDMLFRRMSKYHFKVDAAGELTEEPDDSEEDELDALRYLVMNVFAPKGALIVPDRAQEDPLKKMHAGPNGYDPYKAWDQIMGVVKPDEKPEAADGKRGSFMWSL